MNSTSREKPLRILLTNNTLATPAGTELVLRDLAIGLLRRGHLPVAYSTVLGDVAAELERATVPVISNLADLDVVPDVIHGQHHLETMSAALWFSQTPVVYVCHGWQPWEEYPPSLGPNCHYVAVDNLTRERLLTSGLGAADRISTIYNFVDLQRFRRRSRLPKQPKRALIFSNIPTDVDTEIRKACATVGIDTVDLIGASSGNSIAEPEKILGHYDVVFAKGRAAIEALATGCAVVVCDYSKLGALVRTENIDHIRAFNFGIRTMQREPSFENIAAELKLYDPEDAIRTSDLIRANGSLEGAIDKYLDVYYSALASPHCNIDHGRLASQYLQWLSPTLKHRQAPVSTKQRIRSRMNEMAASHSPIAWRSLRAYGRLRKRVKRIFKGK